MLPRNLLLAIVTLSAHAQNSRLTGIVRDSLTMEALPNVEILLSTDDHGMPPLRTSTNRLGNFVFRNLSPGSYTVVARGFQRVNALRTLIIADSISEHRVELFLGTGNVELGEIIVHGENAPGRSPVKTHDIEPHVVRSLPAIGGEPDAFRPLYFLPGVTIGSELLGGLHVRGSSPDQNLVMLDGVPLLNPAHFGGLISIFNPDILGSARLSKEILDVSYGGRAASLLEVTTREPSHRGLAGSAGVSLLSSRLTLEGPLTDNVGIIVSGRRLYADLIVPIVADPVRTPLYYFYDVRELLFPRIDVDGYVTDGRVLQPLMRRSEGFYTCTLPLVDGETYTLVATWQGKQVTARVTKPHSPRIDTFMGNMTILDSAAFTFTWNASFVPRAGEGYIVYFGVVIDTFNLFLNGVDSLTIANSGADGRIHVGGSHTWLRHRSDGVPHALTARVIAFDWSFYQYYSSLPREGGLLPLYVISGGPLQWNVEGDGVGIVWSESASLRTYPLQP